MNRRISGGGAVLNSERGEITYSVILKEDNPHVSTDPVESYHYLCQGIIEALAVLGIKADFKPINHHVGRLNGDRVARRREDIRAPFAGKRGWYPWKGFYQRPS